MSKVGYGLIFIVLLIGVIFQTIPAYADSGWDSSYDSGGWGGGSSWGGSSSWDSGGSGGSRFSIGSGYDIELVIIIIAMCLFFLIEFIKLVIKIINLYKKWKEINIVYSTSCIEKKVQSHVIENVKEIIPDFNKSHFKMQVFDIYKRIQVAWMDFDYETLRKYTTDELYNLYHSQLVALNVKRQQNVMRDFELKKFEIVGVEKIGNTIALKVRMTVECFDYVIDKTNKVVRGTDKQKMVYDYEMTFIKGMDTKMNKCPNCNAPLENMNSTICPYCDSAIVSNNHDWVLSKKQMIKQYRK